MLRPRSCGGDLLVELLPGTGWLRHRCMQFIHEEHVFNRWRWVSLERKHHCRGPPCVEIHMPLYLVLNTAEELVRGCGVGSKVTLVTTYRWSEVTTDPNPKGGHIAQCVDC